MGAQERNLSKWLESNINASRRLGKFHKIQVRHVQRGNKIGDEVAYFDVPESPDESWIDEIVREVIETVTTETENLGGVQKFACYSFFDKSEEPVNRHVLRVAAESNPGEEKSLDSEGPDNAGLVSQSMRHTEAFARLATAGSTAQVNTLLKMVEKQGAMIDALMTDKLENMKIVNELLDKRMERELEMEKVKTREKAIEAGIESAKLLAPVILNKVVGKKLLPEADNGLAKLGYQFFKSISASPEQLAKIVGSLNQQQQIALMELIESFERAAAEEKPS